MKKQRLRLRLTGWLSCMSLLLLLLMMPSMVFAQQKITGKVIDRSGEPLIGVSVIVKGTTIGGVTDIDGEYAVEVQSSDDVLVMSYVGYESAEFPVGSRSVIDVTMNEDILQMQEIVVVGYGSIKKSDITGAVSSVRPEDLSQTGTIDVAEGLQGRIAGVNVVPNSGDPVSGVTVTIRGAGNFGNSQPLYVIDGYQTDDISFINPSDVQSMEVLKDASATAIYGARGANGVILVTTKRGKSGAPQIQFNSFVGVSQPWQKLDMANAAQYSELFQESYTNDGVAIPADVQDRLDFVDANGSAGTDWQRQVFREEAISQDYNISVLGGNDTNKYSFSAAYRNQEGLIKNNDVNKFFLKLNNDLQINKWLSAGLGFNYLRDEWTRSATDQYAGVLPAALKADPLAPAYDEHLGAYGDTDLSQGNNPFRIVEEMAGDRVKRDKIVSSVYVQARIIEGLTFRSSYTLDISNRSQKTYRPTFYVAPDEQREVSSLYQDNAKSINWISTNRLNYEKNLGDHNINAMAGVEVQGHTFDKITADAFDVPDYDALRHLSASRLVEGQKVSSEQNETYLLSYFARVNYSFADKYVATATVRMDGSSKLHPDKRWTNPYPSFALGWNVHNEGFLSASSLISLMKVRAGWGKVGNERNADNHGYITLVDGDQVYSFNGIPVQGRIPTSLSNPDLVWETVETINIGVDAGFFDGRLTATADYFIKDTKDLIANEPVPEFIGAYAAGVNAASIKNTGVEVSLGFKGVVGDFKYNIVANATMISNEVTDLGNGVEFIEGGNVNKVGNTTRTTVGEDLGYFYGLRTDGIFNDQDELDAHVDSEGNAIQPLAVPGDVKFVDHDGNGVIDAEDRVKLGSRFADFTWGFNSNFSYKNLDLQLFLTGSQGNEIVNSLVVWTESSQGFNNSLTSRMDRWNADNTASNEPRMTLNDANENARFSDRYVQDGSYIRLKNIQLGYTLPAALMSKIGVQKLRIYVAADNLLTITDYEGFDPELGAWNDNPFAVGVDVATIPQARTFRGGLNITF
ncbi:MAG: TonB-dependent receptor [Reichenbachiella sp.]|uniref:SusC/RagA family TonB-linked outer membrane protein n=3 Tax=Reichenbachiella sp. TaxID=2184521 RepID=UPI003265E5FB